MKILIYLILLVIILTCTPPARSASILGVFPLAGKSFNILYNKLMKGLADAGHDVTVISAYKNKLPIQNGTYSDVILTGFAEYYSRMLDEYNLTDVPEESYSVWESKRNHDYFLQFSNKTFHHPNVKKLLQSNKNFDLLIMEQLWSDSILAFAAYYNCPSVVFSSTGGVNPWTSEMVGNLMPISYVPHYYMVGDYSGGITFFQRLHNLLYYVADSIEIHFYGMRDHDELIKQAFPDKNIPSVSKLYYTPSLVLLGSHSSLRQATPLVPNIVEIGGFHIDPPKILPPDIREFLESAKDGAVYFSMGSHIKSTDFTDERKRMFLNVFAKLKMKVLWKFEEETLSGKPENVMIKSWVPQADVLAHPNIKLFITHAGQGSVLETIDRGVPALMIPTFADQFNNAHHCVAKGFALKLSYSDKNFTEETLYSMIKELLINPVYKEKAKEISKLHHDRPMKPLETAVYWVEYVIRHKGADHLKVAAIHLPWYKLYMVDVWLFIGFVVVAISYAITLLLKLVFHKCNLSNSQKIKKH